MDIEGKQEKTEQTNDFRLMGHTGVEASERQGEGSIIPEENNRRFRKDNHKATKNWAGVAGGRGGGDGKHFGLKMHKNGFYKCSFFLGQTTEIK